MPARSGADYIASLKRMQPEVYYDGRRVKDVTEEPVFAPGIQAIAQQFDLQLDPRYRDVMTYTSPTSGEPVSSSFMIPYSREDLVKKRQHFKLRTDHNFGFMGRAPDFMNCFVTGWAVGKDRFGLANPRYAENAWNYYEYVREHDLFLTHTLVAPQTDRSKTSAQQEDPFTHLGLVRETADGIIVRGAKMLGTMAPICEEVAVVPYGGVAPGDDAYAVTFTLPNNTPGLKYICRETVAPGPRNRFDHPLSSRFEEMDCIAIFDDVLVPWDRVLVDGKPGSREVLNAPTRPEAGLTLTQVSSRMLSQMEFFCGLAMRLADAIGITGFLHIQEKLGEMLSYLEIGRSVFYGAEATAQQSSSGIWIASSLGQTGFHMRAATHIYARMVDIVQTLAGGGFFYAPTRADLDNPEIRPYLDKYVRGRPGIDAEERIALFKLAWDVTGESFAQRMKQYVHFYSGDPIRNMAGFYLGYPKEELLEIVDRALGHRDDLDIPISPESPAVPRGPRGALGLLTGAYPANSHPTPAKTGAATT